MHCSFMISKTRSFLVLRTSCSLYSCLWSNDAEDDRLIVLAHIIMSRPRRQRLARCCCRCCCLWWKRVNWKFIVWQEGQSRRRRRVSAWVSLAFEFNMSWHWQSKIHSPQKPVPTLDYTLLHKVNPHTLSTPKICNVEGAAIPNHSFDLFSSS